MADYTRFYEITAKALEDDRGAAARDCLKVHGINMEAARRMELGCYDPQTMPEAKAILEGICAEAVQATGTTKPRDEMTDGNTPRTEIRIHAAENRIKMAVIVAPITPEAWAGVPIVPTSGRPQVLPTICGSGVWNDTTIPATGGRPLYIAPSLPDAIALEAAGASAIWYKALDKPQILLKCERNPPRGIVICLPDSPASAGSMQATAEDLKANGIDAIAPAADDMPTTWTGAWDAAATGILSVWIAEYEGRLETGQTADLVRYEGQASGPMVHSFIDRMMMVDRDSAIPTGIQDLDEFLGGGMLPGLYVLGAESSVGKTSLALQMAYNISDAGHDVLFYTCEQSADELTAKGISRLTKAVAQRIGWPDRGLSSRSVLYKSSEWANRNPDREILERAAELYEAGASRLWIIEADMTREDDGRGPGQRIGLDTISAGIKRHHDLMGRNPVVFVDYLQILDMDMSTEKFTDKRTDKQRMDDAITTLRGYSKDYQIPVVVISSLNRAAYGGPTEYQSFKESGAIEYSSDVLMGMFYEGLSAGQKKSDQDLNRQIRDENRGARYTNLELRILKNRNGAKGSLYLQFDQLYGDFMRRTPPQDHDEGKDMDDRQRALDELFKD